MRKGLLGILAIALLLSFVLAGCAQKKASSTQEAIDVANAIDTIEQKVTYLLGQARAFYNSKEYKQTIEIGQYVLSKIDPNSQEAKDLIEKAKSQLAAAVDSAAAGVKKSISSFGK